MNVEVTIKEALSVGKRMVIFPSLAILIGFSFGFGIVLDQFKIHLSIGLFVGFLSGFVAMKLYWNYSSKKWQLWAFSNVKNVNELKRKAIENRLINKNFILDDKKQIRDNELRKKIAHIQKKFDSKEVFHDAFSIPKVTKIKASKIGETIPFILGFFMLGCVIYGYLEVKTASFYLIIAFAVALFFWAIGIFAIFHKVVLIRMDDTGVQLHQKEFIRWEEVLACFVEKRLVGDHYAYYIVFQLKTVTIEFSINGLELNPQRIEKLAQIYWFRNKKKYLNR